MDTKKLTSLLSKQARKRIDALLGGDFERKRILFSASASQITDRRIGAFEEFVQHPGFERFLQRRKTSSLGRLEKTLELLTGRLEMEIDPDIVGNIAGEMSSNDYRLIERSFYIIPIDLAGFTLFEKGFVQIGEQNSDLMADYFRLCLSSPFLLLRNALRDHYQIWENIFQRIVSLLLAKKSSESVEECCRLIGSDACLRFLHLSNLAEKIDLYILNIFIVFYRHPRPEQFFSMIQVFSKRYTYSENPERIKKDLPLMARIFSLWDYFYQALPENTDEFRSFLRLYGSLRDDFQLFVWELVFSVEPAKTARVVALFISTSFASLKGFYGQDLATMKFLIRHIVAALVEMKIRNFNASLFKLVLKLFLGLKVDRQFLKRRAVFFEALKIHTASARMESEVIRMLFFEYIYIALKQAALGYPPKMTKFCDDLHREFCLWVDEKYMGSVGLDRDAKVQYFMPMITRLRQTIWESSYRKFPGNSYYIDEVCSASVSTNLEDEVLAALDVIEPEEAPQYCITVMDIFRTDPERMREAAAPDFWYRLEINRAYPFAHGTILPIVGSVNIQAGKCGAYTDGHTIFLPPYINYFKDPLDPLIENRNLTFYVSLALHEAGHIIAGTFRFNLWYYLTKLERPDVFKAVHNFIEDIRIEIFLMKINAHPQVKELLDSTNEFLACRPSMRSASLAIKFLSYIYDSAYSYGKKLKSLAWYPEFAREIFGAQVNTGRFRNMQTLCEYAVERVTHMDIPNPLAAYPIARELYEIMKHWPESDLQGILDQEYYVRGQHEILGSEGKSRPLTQEELDELYKEYNENPRAFLEANGLPCFPELLGSEAPDSGTLDTEKLLTEYINNLLDVEDVRYDEAGTIDFSHRTRADDLLASRQIEGGRPEEKEISATEPEKPVKKKPEKSIKTRRRKKKHVYSIDAKTKSRTRISQIKEFEVKRVDRQFLRKFRKWDYIADRVYRMLAAIFPSVEEEYDRSAVDGEINMDLLVEMLSAVSSARNFEFLDNYIESRRSLAVVIGLDASDSTSLLTRNYTGSAARQTQQLRDGQFVEHLSLTDSERIEYDMIIDIEKAFAMIFGKALSFLTDDITLLAFNSLTSTNIYRASSLEAVSAFMPDAANRDGDFIRYVREMLRKNPAEIKYFFMISDGQPQSVNYSGKEALDDTLIAMRETVNDGIKLVYFNIDLVRGAYFDQFQHEATYAEHFSNPEDLLPAIGEMVRTVIQSIQ